MVAISVIPISAIFIVIQIVYQFCFRHLLNRGFTQIFNSSFSTPSILVGFTSDRYFSSCLMISVVKLDEPGCKGLLNKFHNIFANPSKAPAPYLCSS